MILKSLLIAGALQGIFLIVLLRTKAKPAPADYLLMAWLGVTALELLFYYDSLSAQQLAPHFIQLLGFFLPLIASPILYLYVAVLSGDTLLFSKFRWVHLAPYLSVCLFLFLYVGADYIRVVNGFLRVDATLPVWIQNALTIPLAIVPGLYTLLSLLALLTYQKKLPDTYSFTEKINLNWLKWVVISLTLLFVVLFTFIKFAPRFGVVTYSNLFAVVGSVLALYLYLIGFLGLQQTTVFINNPTSHQPKLLAESRVSYKNSGLSEAACNQAYERLLVHMNQQKPYLDESLSLATLAQQLNLSPNQLSQVINQKAKLNFFNFINGYRVEAVKQRLKDPALAHYSILAIGFDCGFQSKSSFNKIFKQMTKMTPLEYQKS
jgi:AraC-like DNA-binding protein